MSLNKEQQAAFADVINFINNTNETYMNISGSAGTGKTYFISQIADSVLQHKNKNSLLYRVALTATTNKATAVISSAMPSRANEIMTVYAFMNLRVSEDFKTGKVKIIPTASWRVHSNTLLVIDECSMVNKELFSWLEKGLDDTCKILFVGDKNQLAPIKEEISPIYANNYRTSYLTEPVRNAEQPALMELCEQAKQTVLTGVFTPIVPVPGVIDIVSGPQLQGILEREYHTENAAKRVLSYTNKKVVQYNDYIRQLRGYIKPFEIGEILSNNESAELASKERLYTDQLVEVTEILSDTINQDVIKGHEIRIIQLTVKDVMSPTLYSVNVFADSADRRDVLKHYANVKQWDKYFKIKNSYPDLRSIAASTTHKAQGSTYDSVIVDLADIGSSTNKAQTARMQYVALSRPKSRIFIKGELPERYFK